MSALLHTPWGKLPLPLPGGTSIRFSLRVAGPCVAEVPAPGRVSSSLPVPGAGQSSVLAAGHFTAEGDLIAVPPFERAGVNRFSDCASARAGVAARGSVPPDALSRAPP